MTLSLHEYLDQQEGVTKERFVIENEEQANWALRKLKQIEEERKENIALAEAEIQKVEAWLEEVNKKTDDEVERFNFLLKEYAMKCRQENPKFKSMKLPQGKLSFRKQQPQWNYDEKQLLEYLKTSGNEELIRVKEEPDKATIKKTFSINENKVIDPNTGEIVDGITVEEREDAFKVEVN